MSDKLQCPYDPLHQIAANSFGKHLLKCERQHPEMKLARCPLNSFHRFPPEYLKAHLKDCPSRAEIEVYKNTAGTVANALLHTFESKPLEVIVNTSPTAVEGSLAVDNEVWDDFTYKAYDPVQHCKLRQQEDPTFIAPAACKLVGGGGSTQPETKPPATEAVAGPLIKQEPASSSEDSAPVPCQLTPKQESGQPVDRKPHETSRRGEQEVYRADVGHSSKKYKPYGRTERTRKDSTSDDGSSRSYDHSYRNPYSDKYANRRFDERSRGQPYEGRAKYSRGGSYRYFDNYDYQ
uniref:CHHC U11-48K-type domain-containing protein n=1 Tax=Anopheles triannulatus TaxID=58253 RepID=A0A2M4AQY5_9DIPT